MRRSALRTLLYEATNVMLTRYKGQLKLKDRAFAIATLSHPPKSEVGSHNDQGALDPRG